MFSKRALHDYLINLWHNSDKKPPLGLQMLALLYSILIRTQRIKTHTKLPTIVVGNISIGGTGKSPLVSYIANMLLANDIRPGIIMRGYGGKRHSCLVNGTHTVEDVGDEAIMLRAQTTAPIVADKNRAQAADFLYQQQLCDCLISDDGLQNTKLARDIELITIDTERVFGNKKLLPAGPLRSPITRLQGADALLLSGKQSITNTLSFAPSYRMQLKAIACIDLVTQAIIPITEWVAQYSKTLLHAVAAIGNPERFFTQLTELGLTFAAHRFIDHHQFKRSELMFEKQQVVVMTHKDAVKCNFLEEANTYFYLKTALTIEAENAHIGFDNFLLQKLQKLPHHKTRSAYAKNPHTR